MDFRVVVQGVEVPNGVTTDDTGNHGWADLIGFLSALGAPVQVIDGRLMVMLRSLLDAGMPSAYDAATNTLTIGKAAPQPQPLPQLPADPVGAGVSPWVPVTAPITSAPANRSPQLLDLVIRQFHVADHPQLQPGLVTWCNIFLWWWSLAMRAEIPHWVVSDGTPAAAGAPGAREQDANGVVLWLRTISGQFGWRRGSATDAMTAANTGCPAAVVWYNPGGIGHVAVVRPGTADPERGVPIAQAGARNFDDGFLTDGFGVSRMDTVEYYVHD